MMNKKTNHRHGAVDTQGHKNTNNKKERIFLHGKNLSLEFSSDKDMTKANSKEDIIETKKNGKRKIHLLFNSSASISCNHINDRKHPITSAGNNEFKKKQDKRSVKNNNERITTSVQHNNKISKSLSSSSSTLSKPSPIIRNSSSNNNNNKMNTFNIKKKNLVEMCNEKIKVMYNSMGEKTFVRIPLKQHHGRQLPLSQNNNIFALDESIEKEVILENNRLSLVEHEYGNFDTQQQRIRIRKEEKENDERHIVTHATDISNTNYNRVAISSSVEYRMMMMMQDEDWKDFYETVQHLRDFVYNRVKLEQDRIFSFASCSSPSSLNRSSSSNVAVNHDSSSSRTPSSSSFSPRTPPSPSSLRSIIINSYYNHYGTFSKIAKKRLIELFDFVQRHQNKTSLLRIVSYAIENSDEQDTSILFVYRLWAWLQHLNVVVYYPHHNYKTTINTNSIQKQQNDNPKRFVSCRNFLNCFQDVLEAREHNSARKENHHNHHFLYHSPFIMQDVVQDFDRFLVASEKYRAGNVPSKNRYDTMIDVEDAIEIALSKMKQNQMDVHILRDQLFGYDALPQKILSTSLSQQEKRTHHYSNNQNESYIETNKNRNQDNEDEKEMLFLLQKLDLLLCNFIYFDARTRNGFIHKEDFCHVILSHQNCAIIDTLLLISSYKKNNDNDKKDVLVKKLIKMFSSSARQDRKMKNQQAVINGFHQKASTNSPNKKYDNNDHNIQNIHYIDFIAFLYSRIFMRIIRRERCLDDNIWEIMSTNSHCLGIEREKYNKLWIYMQRIDIHPVIHQTLSATDAKNYCVSHNIGMTPAVALNKNNNDKTDIHLVCPHLDPTSVVKKHNNKQATISFNTKVATNNNITAIRNNLPNSSSSSSSEDDTKKKTNIYIRFPHVEPKTERVIISSNKSDHDTLSSVALAEKTKTSFSFDHKNLVHENELDQEHNDYLLFSSMWKENELLDWTCVQRNERRPTRKKGQMKQQQQEKEKEKTTKESNMIREPLLVSSIPAPTSSTSRESCDENSIDHDSIDDSIKSVCHINEIIEDEEEEKEEECENDVLSDKIVINEVYDDIDTISDEECIKDDDFMNDYENDGSNNNDNGVEVSFTSDEITNTVGIETSNNRLEMIVRIQTFFRTKIKLKFTRPSMNDDRTYKQSKTKWAVFIIQKFLKLCLMRRKNMNNDTMQDNELDCNSLDMNSDDDDSTIVSTGETATTSTDLPKHNNNDDDKRLQDTSSSSPPPQPPSISLSEVSITKSFTTCTQEDMNTIISDENSSTSTSTLYSSLSSDMRQEPTFTLLLGYDNKKDDSEEEKEDDKKIQSDSIVSHKNQIIPFLPQVPNCWIHLWLYDKWDWTSFFDHSEKKILMKNHKEFSIHESLFFHRFWGKFFKSQLKQSLLLSSLYHNHFHPSSSSFVTNSEITSKLQQTNRIESKQKNKKNEPLMISGSQFEECNRVLRNLGNKQIDVSSFPVLYFLYHVLQEQRDINTQKSSKGTKPKDNSNMRARKSGKSSFHKRRRSTATMLPLSILPSEETKELSFTDIHGARKELRSAPAKIITTSTNLNPIQYNIHFKTK